MLERRTAATLGIAALAAAILSSRRRARPRRRPPTAARRSRKRVRSSTRRRSACSTSAPAGRADWVQTNFITDDTEKIAAEANKDLIAATMELAKAATRFDGWRCPRSCAGS